MLLKSFAAAHALISEIRLLCIISKPFDHRKLVHRSYLSQCVFQFKSQHLLKSFSACVLF